MTDAEGAESGWLVAIRRHAPFKQDLTRFCIHGVVALLRGFPGHFVRRHFTLWPLGPPTNPSGFSSQAFDPQCVLCAASGAAGCALVSEVRGRSLAVARFAEKTPAKLATQEVAENEIWDRVEDLCDVVLEPSGTGQDSADSRVEERVAALKQALATHESLFGDHATVSCCGFLYEADLELQPLDLDDMARVTMDVHTVEEVVRSMVGAIRANSIRDLRADALVRDDLWAWENLWGNVLQAASNGQLGFRVDGYLMHGLALCDPHDD